MTRRVALNLIVFGIIGVVLAAWAATNVLAVPAITHPYDITADFASSPGLQSHFQVAYLGVKVGQISSVRLEPGEAVVTLTIDHGVKLPVGVLAAAARESPIGEPYVALSPPPGYVNGGPYLASGYRIGVDHTSAPLSYEDVFAAVDKLAAAVPPSALATVLHQLALALNGRGDTIRQLIANTDSLTTTLAANSGQIDQLIGDLSQLTATLSAHRGAIGSSLDDLSAVAATLATNRASIDALLADAPSFATSVDSIVSQSSANLGCLLDGLGQVATDLASPDEVAALQQVLLIAPTIATLIPKIDASTPVGRMLYGGAQFNLANPPVAAYTKPRTLPAVPAVPACPGGVGGSAAGGAPSGSGAGGASGAGGGAGGSPGAAATVPVPGVPAHASAVGPSSTEKLASHHQPIALVAAIAGVLLVIVVAAQALAVRRRRRAA